VISDFLFYSRNTRDEAEGGRGKGKGRERRGNSPKQIGVWINTGSAFLSSHYTTSLLASSRAG
jgi:hypothetical protein